MVSTMSFLFLAKLEKRAQSLSEGKSLKVMAVGNVSKALSLHRLAKADEYPCSSVSPPFFPLIQITMLKLYINSWNTVQDLISGFLHPC